MSQTIDNEIVSMQFENAQFEKGVAQSMKSLANLKNSILSMENTNGGLNNISIAVASIGHQFSAMEQIAVGVLRSIGTNALNMASNLARSLSIDNVVAGWSKFEDKSVSVATLLGQTNPRTGELYELDYVNEQLEKLNWYSDETSYNFTDMVANIAKFTSVGENLDDSVLAMEGIANWAAKCGVNASNASRAMYQISQAMSIGAMKYQDWRSIQNLSMDTLDFKNKVLELGVAEMKLQKVRVKNNETGEISEKYLNKYGQFIDAENFASTLSSGWFDKELMMDVFSSYSTTTEQLYNYMRTQLDEDGNQIYDTAREALDAMIADESITVDDFGKSAFLAAQEARTFTDVIGATKDAVSTGWMNIFEDLFGDVKTATEFWGYWVDSFWDIFAEPVIKFEKTLRRWAHELGGQERFLTAVQKGWDSIASVLFAVRDAFSGVFPEKTKEELLELTENFENFVDKTTVTEDQLIAIQKIFEGLFSTFKVVGQVVSGIFKGFTKGFSDMFNSSGAITDFIVSVMQAIKKFADASVAFDTFEKIGRAVGYVIGFIVDAVQQLIAKLGELSVPITNIMDHLSKIGTDIFAKMKDFGASMFGKKDTENGSNLSDSLNGINSELQDYTGNTEAASESSNIFVMALDAVYTALTKLKALPSKILSGIAIILGQIKNQLNDWGIFNIFDGIKKVLLGILTIVKTLFSFIIKGLGKINFNSVVEFLSTVNSWLLKLGTTGGILYFLYTIVSSFATTLKMLVGSLAGISSVAVNFGGVFESLTGVFESLQASTKADLLIKIAAGVLVLAFAMAIISRLDADAVSNGLASITIMITDLTAATRLLMKDSSMGRGITKVLLTMSVAILIMASALKKISSIDEDALTGAIVAVSILVADLVAATKVLNGKTIKGSLGLVGMATAILILSGACSVFSKMSWEGILKGLLAVSTLMAVTVLLANQVKAGKMIAFGVAMIPIAIGITILSAACKILETISWEGILKGILAVSAMLAAVVLLTNEVKAGKMIVFGLAIIPIAAGITILAAACKILEHISWSDMLKNLVALFGMLMSISVAANIVKPMRLLAMGLALIPIATGIVILTSACLRLAKLSWSELLKGVIGISALLAITAILAEEVKVGKLLALSAALTLVGVAMIVMGGALSIIAHLSWDELLRSLVGILGVMLTLGVVAKTFDPGKMIAVAGTMIVFGAAVTILSIGLGMLALIPWGGLLVGLVAIAGSLLILGVAASVATAIIPQMAIMAGILLAVGTSAMALGAGIALAALGFQAFVTALRMLVDMVTEDGEILMTAIEEIGMSLLELIPRILTAVGEGFVTLVKVVSTGITSVLDAFSEINGRLTEGLPKFVFKLIRYILESLDENLPSILKSVTSIINQLMDVLVENLPTILDHVITILLAVLDALIEYLPQILDRVELIIVDILEGITDSIPKFLEKIMDIICAIIIALGDAVVDLVMCGVDLILGLLQGIVDATDRLIDGTILVIKELIDTIGDFVEDFLECGVELIQAILDGILSVVPKVIDMLYQVVIDLLNGLADAIEKNHDELKKAVVRILTVVWKCILDWFDSNELWDDSKSIGENIIKGLGEGLKSGANLIKNTVTAAAEKVSGFFKDFFGIHSPSRLFAEYGEYLDLGLAKGLVDNTDSVKTAADEVGETTISTMSKALSGINDLLQNDMDFDPVIRPVIDLSDIENGANSIDELFGQQKIDASVNGNIDAISTSMNNRNMSVYDDILDAINSLKQSIADNSGTTYNVNGVSYTDNADVSGAIGTLVRAARVGGRA